jgi:hypothetical protein
VCTADRSGKLWFQCCFLLPTNHELSVPDGWVCLPDDSAILPVQVTSCERTAVVANYHSIRVQHWHQLEDELVSQLLTAMEHDLENRLERCFTATGTQYSVILSFTTSTCHHGLNILHKRLSWIIILISEEKQTHGITMSMILHPCSLSTPK